MNRWLRKATYDPRKDERSPFSAENIRVVLHRRAEEVEREQVRRHAVWSALSALLSLVIGLLSNLLAFRVVGEILVGRRQLAYVGGAITFLFVAVIVSTFALRRTRAPSSIGDRIAVAYLSALDASSLNPSKSEAGHA